MTENRTLYELCKFAMKDYGGVTPERGTLYPCTQQQIDAYTVEPYCYQGNDHVMSEHDAIRMLEDFLDPNRPPMPRVRAALQRITDAMCIQDDWYPDVILKAAHDIDTAFFMGWLEGNVRIQWMNQIKMVEQLGDREGHALGITRYRRRGCSSIWLSMEAIFYETEYPRRRMWQTLFHEMIHAFCLAVHHNPNPTPYDISQGWVDGHGYTFRRCLQAVEARTKRYFENLCIASAEDSGDFRTIR
ncbi:hypothetical protein MMC22_008367 [Lobaria immixta]|nr:hypothetical protein [Lobaria immixta]